MTWNSLSAVVMALVLTMTLIPATVFAEINPPEDRGDGILENNGDWLIDNGEEITHVGETIIINGNITVVGKLTLQDCELIMNATNTSIVVNGELDLSNTNITGNDLYYAFIVYGKVHSVDSNFSNMSGSDNFPYAGGLQVYSSDVFIEGGSITNNEFAGIYITQDIIMRNLTVVYNKFNVVVNGSSPQFIDCDILIEGGDESFFVFNGASPYLVASLLTGGRYIYDEESSVNIGHRLNVHVVYENGTSIPDVRVSVRSYHGDIQRNVTTDDQGRVIDMILPEYTEFYQGGDKVYTPYYISAEKFGLLVMESTPFGSDTSLKMTLTGDYFGETLSRGDYNGDGLVDLVVGVPRNRTELSTHGMVFVFLNNGSLELTDLTESMADLTIKGVEGTGFGTVLCSGDINGDGFDDLLLATPFSSENGGESGRVYFFMGNDAPAWNDLSDANFTFDGDQGDHFGKHLFIGDINNDDFEDFVIGDDDNSFVFFSTANPQDDFTTVSDFISYATGKGPADDTSQSVTKTNFDDNDRYDLDPQEEMHIKNFTIEDSMGNPTEITLKFQFVTDRYYGYNSGERGYVYYSVDGDNWHETTIRPAAPNNNWDRETTLTFDLLSDGVTSLEQLKNIEIYYKNLEGQQGNDHYIHIDYVQIYLSAVPKGANHTLEAGNLSSGDVNGDSYPDLIISDVARQTVYYGGPLGLSAPEILQMDLYLGNHTRTIVKSGNLTITETRPYLNGQFDDGWNGWQQVANSRGQKDGGARWDIVESANGDWEVHEGPTGGFGVNQDTLDGDNNRDCRGMLRTEDFLVTDDMETIHFWYNFGARSLEQEGDGWGQNYDDEIRYRLFSAENDSVLMELAGWAPSGSGKDYDEDGTVDADISGFRGDVVYFGFEIITNRGNSDRAIAQVDNFSILPEADIPYYENGSLESEWYQFEGNLSSMTPWWEQEVTSGALSVKFRTDPGISWNETANTTSGQTLTMNETSDRLQYRIEMSDDGSATPRLRDLRLAIILVGQRVPLSLSTNSGYVGSADMNGDGIDDLLFHGGQDSRGQGINIFYGNENLSELYNASDIQELYDGEAAAFSVIDLESDGVDELVLSGDSIRIIDSMGSILWEKSSMTSSLVGDVASDPTHHLNTGEIYFIPSHDREIRVLDISIPAFIDPDEQRTIDVGVGNIGTQDFTDIVLYLNITADGYSHSDSRQLDVDSMSFHRYEFLWDVPAEEGVEYNLTAEIHIRDDRIPANNELSIIATSKIHMIRLLAGEPHQSAHGGDELVYNLTIENIGTFEIENVSLDSTLPPDWTGEYRWNNTPVDHIMVTEMEELTFMVRSPGDEEKGDFTINLSTTAVTAISALDLTATILRPDLIIEEIQLLRGDGVRTNDTIHGVDGDLESIRILVKNQGPTYSNGFTLSLSKNGQPYEDFIGNRLESGDSSWFVTSVVPEEGILNLTAEVDSWGEIAEEDETNNQLGLEYTIKGVEPVGPYDLTGLIQDIESNGVASAEIIIEWDGNREEGITDENGNFSFSLAQPSYHDTVVLYLNATDGENITSTSILLYSEDGGKYVVLTLKQYLVEVRGPDTISSIDLNGTLTIHMEVINQGNTESTYIAEASDIPLGWSVKFPELSDDFVILDIGESKSVAIDILSSPDPLRTMGYQKYSITVMVYSEINAQRNDSFSHSIEVLPMDSLLVMAQGENATAAKPGEVVNFEFSVENRGNVRNTLIPHLMGNSVESYEFNISFVVIGVGAQAHFSLSLVMPYIATGSVLDLLVGSDEEFVTNAEIHLTAQDYYDVSCTVPSDFMAKPSEVITIDVYIKNTGNLREDITIGGSSDIQDVVIQEGYETLDMEEGTTHELEVTLPADALKGDLIPIIIHLSIDSTLYLSLPVNITIIEVPGITLTELETTITPGPDFTVYRFGIEARNTGNGINTFHFRAHEKSYPGFMSLPDPITLEPGATGMIYPTIIVPFNHTGEIVSNLIPLDDTGEYDELRLGIPPYSLSLETQVTPSQEDSIYYYDITVKNTGDRFERLEVITGIPKTDAYDSGDKRWVGGSNKDFIELFPDDSGNVTIWVVTPELRKYYGTNLTVSLRSESGKTTTIDLHKPPIAILGATIPESASFEDYISFTSSQSVWNIDEYHWDFGDGIKSTDVSVIRSFGRAGEHQVTLTVVDEKGFTASRSIKFEIVNTAPIAVIQAKPLNRIIEVGEPIKLDASFSLDRDGEIVEYLWEFGKFGEFYQGLWATIEHSYDEVGTYTITLHVKDDHGDVTNATVDITVVPITEDPEPDPDTDEKTTTDPLSYAPGALIVLLALVGVVLILRKKVFIDHLIWKISEKQRKK